MAWSDDNSSGGDAPREFDLCTGLAGLDELRLALFGGCAEAGSECDISAALRRRHECGSTDDEGKQQVAACGKHRATVQCGANVSARAERVQRDAAGVSKASTDGCKTCNASATILCHRPSK